MGFWPCKEEAPTADSPFLVGGTSREQALAGPAQSKSLMLIRSNALSLALRVGSKPVRTGMLIAMVVSARETKQRF